jgi:hypothetical protein
VFRAAYSKAAGTRGQSTAYGYKVHAALTDSGCEGDDGGEGGIRTHGTLAGTTVFETVPIGHSGTSPALHFRYLAERVGFEPTVEFPLHTLSKRAP